MITILPQTSETLIVPHAWDVVVQRLMDVTTSRIPEVGSSPKILAGWVKDDRFQLIIRQRRPNSFMPMVEGRIDPTSTGCLIFLQYKLMPITRMYLVLWTIIAFVSGIFLALYNDNFLLSLASIGIIAITHIIAWGNFKLHYRPLHDILFRVLA